MLPVILGEHKTSAAYRALASFFRHKQILKKSSCCDSQKRSIASTRSAGLINGVEWSNSIRTMTGPIEYNLVEHLRNLAPVGVRLCGVTVPGFLVTTVAVVGWNLCHT